MRHRLLIIDDEERTLFAMREYFSTRGFDVDCAQQAGEAVAFLGRQRYTTVIADLRLTGTWSTEGLDIADLVRTRWPATFVILLTAYGSPNIEAKARARRVHAFLHKPHPLPDLEQIVLDLAAERPPTASV